MSHYADYIKEREGYDMIEGEHGFASFLFVTPDICYIRDIYIIPQSRKTKEALALAEEISKIAKERGAKLLRGSVCVGTQGDTNSMRVLLSYGFKLKHVDQNMIYLDKEL
jgi:hypothetical protein